MKTYANDLEKYLLFGHAMGSGEHGEYFETKESVLIKKRYSVFGGKRV
jgi:hypothetical protein